MDQQTPATQPEPAASLTRARVWRYGPLLFWIVFISLASTSGFSASRTSQIIRPLLLWLFPDISEARLDTVHFLTRKAAHFTEYGVLAFLARRAFVTSAHAFLRQQWFRLSLLLIVVYSLLDELHQRFEPTRTGSIYDSAIDLCGGFTVLLICMLWSKRSETRNRAAALNPSDN